MANKFIVKSPIKAPGLEIGNYEFPSSAGLENQILSVDSVGNLVFIDNSAAVEADETTITATGGTGTQLAVSGGLDNQLLVGSTGNDASWGYVSALYDSSGNLVFYYGGVALNAAGKVIASVADPSNAQDAATKNYVDTQVLTKIGTVSEDLTPQLGGDLDLNGHSIDAATGDNIQFNLDAGKSILFGDYNIVPSFTVTAVEVTPATEYSFTFSYLDIFTSTYIDYIFKSDDGWKMGTLFVLNNGTATSITDMGTELDTPSIDFTATLNGGNVDIVGTNLASTAPQDLIVTLRQMS
ncbi:MAG: hypothetical protein M0R77_16970 [Gammaproteobacteria bacterium]|nr:hypothetical protein [Gammaproteobacteria bacterium]